MFAYSGKHTLPCLCLFCKGRVLKRARLGLPVQVFKGLKNDVQQVAIKVIDHTDAQQLAEFAKVGSLHSLTGYAITSAVL